jgi:hypothetical protein
MTLADGILMAVAVTTLFNTGLQYYTTVSTYPLFSNLEEQNFVTFHKAYERKLPLSIYFPYTLLMVSNLFLLFLRPDGISWFWPVVMVLLNASIMAISLPFAAPVHARLDRTGKNERDLAALRGLIYLGLSRQF